MLNRIEEAAKRLENQAHRTPIHTSTQLDNQIGSQVFIKCENFQRAGAFKFRGAFNTISQLTKAQKSRGIITHSSGNHAQAVAITGKILDLKTVIVMPSNSPRVKIKATEGYGAEVVMCEPTQKSRETTVNNLIEKHGYTMVHPYDNDNIIAGAATASKELFEEVGSLDYIVAPIGGGGLISGTALYTKLSDIQCKVIAAEPFGADDAYRSIKNNTHITSQDPTTIADGLRTTLSERTLAYVNEYVDQIIRVRDKQILHAMRFLMERLKLVVEPSGAVPLAAIMNNNIFRNKRIGIIISGGNLDLDNLFESLSPQDE